MEPVSVLVASAFFVGAELARKPTNEFADIVWGRVKKALVKALGRDPVPGDMTEGALETAVATVPELRTELETVLGQSSALRRARLAEQAIRGARILWVDDHPEHNVWERRLLETFGASCLSVEMTRSALASLMAEEFDVVISDIARGDNHQEGIESISAMRAAAPSTPILFYVGKLSSSSPPLQTQGITSEPNELLHLVLDQLERHRL